MTRTLYINELCSITNSAEIKNAYDNDIKIQHLTNYSLNIKHIYLQLRMTTKVNGEICIQNYKNGQYMEVRLAFLLKKTYKLKLMIMA